MPENHAALDGYGWGFVAPDRERDMAAYDALPPQIQLAIDHAPFAISTVAALERYEERGLAYVLAEIAEDTDTYYDACAAETGVPKPEKPLGSGRKRCQR